MTALTDAQDAYAKLLRGEQVMELRDQNGETIKFTRADVGRLAGYIENLKREASTDPIGNRGPMRMVF